MMTHDEMIAVIMHHKNGGEVECRCKPDGAWIYKQHVDINGFDFSRYDYRAKTEPMVIFAEVSYITGQVLRSSTQPMLHHFNNTTIKKFIEAP
jgi:hypothetical protein